MLFNSKKDGRSLPFRRVSFLCMVFIVFLSISYSNAQNKWVPFHSSTMDAVALEPTAVCFRDVGVVKNGLTAQFKISVDMPGVNVTYPFDNGLLGGKYATFHFVIPENSILMIDEIDGAEKTDKLGKPDFPFVKFHVRIPSGVDVSQVKIEAVNTDFVTLSERFAVAPIQKRLHDSFYEGVDVDTRSFAQDKNIYSANAYYSYPVEFESAIMHGIKLLEVSYSPFRYNPVTNEVQVTKSVQLVVTYPETRTAEENTSKIFDCLVQGSVFDGINGLPSLNVAAPKGGTYVVVVGPKMASSAALKEFNDYRKSKGYELVETVESDAAATITSKVKEIYGKKKFEYLIIVGDETVIAPPAGGEGYSYKTWAKLDGSDDIEDVMMGIFLCSDDASLKNIINHQKVQEAGGSWSNTLLATAGAISSPTWGKYSASHWVGVRVDKNNPNGKGKYTIKRAYQYGSTPTSYGGSGSGCGVPLTTMEQWAITPTNPFSNSANTMIKNYWNEGVELIHHRDHGSQSGPSSPSMPGSWVQGITSTTCAPFFLSINCLSGCFINNHTKNFTYQTQVRAPGTCATFSASVTTQTFTNCYVLIAFYDAMFPLNGGAEIKNVGQAYLKGQLKNNTSGKLHYHVFGDPMTMLSYGSVTPINQSLVPVNNALYSMKCSGSNLLYQVPVKGNVNITMYSMQGKLIKSLVKENVNPGTYSLSVYNANNKPASGMYLVKMETAGLTKSINMIVHK